MRKRQRPSEWKCQRCSQHMVGHHRACPECGYTVFDPVEPTLPDEATTMIVLGDTLALKYPKPEDRHFNNVGEHRMVQAWKDNTSDAEWMCFEHGWECWMTEAAQKADPDLKADYE